MQHGVLLRFEPGLRGVEGQEDAAGDDGEGDEGVKGGGLDAGEGDAAGGAVAGGAEEAVRPATGKNPERHSQNPDHRQSTRGLGERWEAPCSHVVVEGLLRQRRERRRRLLPQETGLADTAPLGVGRGVVQVAVAFRSSV